MSETRELKKVAIFIRISDDKKVGGKRVTPEETLRNHKEILIGYCNKHNLEYELFTEIISGGTEDMERRTALKEMLDNLYRFDGILVTELSRLSRETHMAGLIKRQVTKYNKLIITPETDYDLKDPSQALLYDVGNAVSVHERTVMGKRIKNNKISMARQGLNASGAVPLGYIRNSTTKKLEIDVKTAHVVSTAFYLCSLGYGNAKIQKYLNECGYKTKAGNTFTRRAIADMLKRETYKGYTVFRDVEKETTFNEKTGEPIERRKFKEIIIVPDTHAAIVSPEAFDKIQTLRAKREEYFKGQERDKPAKNPSILKDLIYCGVCNRKMRVVTDTNNIKVIRYCYEILPNGTYCNNSGFKVDKVEAKILQMIFEYEEQLKAELNELIKNSTAKVFTGKQKIKDDLEKQLKQLEKEAEKYANIKISMMMDDSNDDITKKVIQDKINENSEARRVLRTKIERLEKELEQPTAKGEIEKRKLVLTTIEKLKEEDDQEKLNNLLKQIIYKIYYKRILPEEIKKLGVRHETRKNFMPELEIEFLD